jgi:multidrug resistance efflux pump
MNDAATPTLKDRVRSLALTGREEKAPPSSSRLPWAFVGALALACALLGYRAYRVSGVPADDRPAVESPGTPGKDRTPGVPTAPTPTEPPAGEIVLQCKGYVVPTSLKQISPRVGGVLWPVEPDLLQEGRLVKKGELLARIDPREYDLEVLQAKAAFHAAKRRWEDLKDNMDEEVRMAEAELDEVKHNVRQMKLEAERNEKLARGSAVAQRDYESAMFGYQAMAARQRRLESNLKMLKDPESGRLKRRIDAAHEEMEQAKARLGTAEMRREWCDIRAPITGTVLTKNAEYYNLFNPAAFSQTGTAASLCEMADLTRLEIDLSVQERDIPLVRQGQKCFIMPEAYQNDREFLARYPRGYVGTVDRLMPKADRAKGAIPVRVRVDLIPEDEAGKYLRPEMGALVSFKGQAAAASNK